MFAATQYQTAESMRLRQTRYAPLTVYLAELAEGRPTARGGGTNGPSTSKAASGSLATHRNVARRYCVTEMLRSSSADAASMYSWSCGRKLRLRPDSIPVILRGQPPRAAVSALAARL